MNTKVLRYLTTLLIVSTICTQDLLGGLKNLTDKVSTDAIIGAVKNATANMNTTGLVDAVKSGNTSAIVNEMKGKASEILGEFKKGKIKSKLPTDLDLSKVEDVDKILNDLNPDNFDMSKKEMIPNLKDLDENKPCIKKMTEIFSWMSMAEQVAFYSAYETSSKNQTTENQGRCFAPRILHRTFRKINRGMLKEMNKDMSNESKAIRNSFSCVSKTFRKLKMTADYKGDIKSFMNTQKKSNQCKSSFMRTLVQTLNGRRRYLLLKNKDSNSTAILNSDGKIIGYSWLESEMEDITKSFLTFAECQQSLPEAITKTYANVLSKISQESVCEQPDAKRLLQGDLNLKDLSGKIADAAKNVDVKDLTNAKNITGKLTNALVDSMKNATLPSGVNVDDIKKGLKNATKAMEGKMKNVTDQIKKAVKKMKKSFSGVEFTEEQTTELKSIMEKLNAKAGNYAQAGKVIETFMSNKDLQSQCNMARQLPSLLTKRNDQLNKMIRQEIKKFDKNEACTEDYAIFITKPKGGAQGSVACSGTNSNCQAMNFEFKSNFKDSAMHLAAVCINSQRVLFGYYDDPNFGQALDYVSKNFETCAKGESNKCAQEFKKMKSGKQPSSKCVPQMKKDCEDEIAKNCEDSRLFEIIGENEPSSSGNPLPKECQNIDEANPDYKNCFTWINKHLIAYTIFPNFEKIDDLQELINESQAARLRYLQDSSIKIVKEDASSTDTVAQMPKSEIEVSSSEVEIDGTTSDSVKVVTDSDVEQNDKEIAPNTNNNQTSSFVKMGYAFVLALLAIMF